MESIFEGKIPGSDFFRKMVFQSEPEVVEVFMVEQAAPKTKKVYKVRTVTETLEELKKMDAGRVGGDEPVEIKKGRWKEDADALVRVLLGVLGRWPDRQDVILHTVTLSLKGELRDEVLSEICGLVPHITRKGKSGRQLDHFLECLLEKFRGKTVDFTGKWKDLTTGGKGVLQRVVGG